MPTLDWIGKKAVENHHKEVPYRLLRCVPELSAGEPDSGNLLVQGDNLEALKALLPYYGGKVKCIYIDPPYNTGNENWVYNDAVNSAEMRQWLGDVVGRDDLSRHDKWLCMMYPRLALLREFLSEDGAIFVSIDDSELHHLLLILCQIFGEEQYRFTTIWQHSVQPKGYSGKVSVHHNYLICYSKSERFVLNDLPRKPEHNVNYSNPDNDPNGPWRSGDVRNALYRPNLIYDLVTPSGKIISPPPKGWRWSKETIQEKIHTGEIVFRDNEKRIVRKIYLNKQEGRPPETIWFGDDVGTTRHASQELKELFDGTPPFDTPKPTNLIERLICLSTKPDDLILDSFSGSGTTGHAVLKLNQQDGGNRRFILVEMEPKIAREITAERVRRVAEGYTNTKGETVPGLGGGFRFCELGATLFAADGSIRDEVKFADLAQHVFFTETREPLSARATKFQTPLLGESRGTAVYLLYNGILKDKTPKGGNVLTMQTLHLLPPHPGPKVVYGTACTLSERTLKRHRITFRQIPYEVKAN